jgi:hypothetical protein
MAMTFFWTCLALTLIFYPVHCHYKLFSMDDYVQMDLWGLEADPYMQQTYAYYLAVVNLWPYTVSLAAIILLTLVFNRIFN